MYANLAYLLNFRNIVYALVNVTSNQRLRTPKAMQCVNADVVLLVIVNFITCICTFGFVDTVNNYQYTPPPPAQTV